MKKFVLLLAASLLSVSLHTVNAQNNGNDFHKMWQERLQSEKIAFLTNEMSLTPKEAQVFWPIYNQAQEEERKALEASFRTFGELDKAIKSGKTGKDLEPLLRAYAESQDRGDAPAKYLKEYLKILPAEKVAKLYLAEEKFRQSKIHGLRQPQMNPGPRFGRPGGENK